MISSIVRLLFIVWGITAMFSCANENHRKAHKNSKKETADLTIGVMPITDCLPFYVAGYSRIFEKEGVKVKLITYKSSLECGAAIRQAKIDGAYLTLPELIFLDGQGVKLKAVMGMDGKMTLVTNRTKRIKKLSSMKERTIAISRHDTSDFLLDEIAEITKIKPFDLLRPQINNIEIRKSMLENNQVDAAVLPSPYDDLSISRGNIKVYSTENSKIKFGCLCFRDSVLKNKKDKIRKLLVSYHKAGNAINKNRNQADSVLIKIYQLSVREKDSLKLPEFSKAVRVSAKDWNKAATWSIKRGYAAKKADSNLVEEIK